VDLVAVSGDEVVVSMTFTVADMLPPPGEKLPLERVDRRGEATRTDHTKAVVDHGRIAHDYGFGLRGSGGGIR
jgi:hypothetical protein